jgi:hypothetical protein
MKRSFFAACATALSLAALTRCSNDPTVINNGTQTNGANVLFIQVDRIGKPGIKELYIPYANHVAYNAASPENDPTAFGPQISAFVTGSPAGRSAAIGSYVAALLSPDALIANLNDSSGRASYLGWETSGQLPVDCTGLAPTAFGGRALDDDVVDAMLGLAFGSSATSTTLTSSTPNVATTAGVQNPPPDDHNEKNGLNGTPNLTNQGVSCTTKGFTPTVFPYLPNPV